VLPHTLEFTRDPHHRLREAHRVLRAEGRLLVLGLNPASLWASAPKAPERPAFCRRSGEFLGYWRLRDWLQPARV
jgi:ubiquinone/menaquinone biosynthesis C-methylase UbiE